MGAPVNTATGDFYTSASDVSLPGAGLPLSFTRTFDAQAAQAEVTAGASGGPLGYGWSYNLGMSLAYNSGAGTATVTEENGAQTNFTTYTSGTSPAWCTSATNFCSSAPRVEATLNHNSDGTWSYVRTNGGHQTFTFNSSGLLTEIADAHGNTLTSSSYSPGTGQTACPTGDSCTAWTSSGSGRELVLAFNGSGQLVEVFDADSTLAAAFAYSGSGCSSWTAGETPDLCSVTDPGSLSYGYTYDSGNSNSDLVYDMLSEQDPGASAATTNTYNSSGLVTQQTDPSGQVMTFTYAGTNSTATGGTTTVIVYPDGTGTGKPQNTTVYDFSSNVLVGQTVGSGGSSPSTTAYARDPVSLLPVWSQDGDSHLGSATYQTYSGSGGTPVSSANALTSTDPAGNTTAAAYNSFNQPWCTVDPADYANGKACPSSPPSSPPSPGAADPNLGATINFYNSADQLTATTDALGNTTTYSYTSSVSGVPNGLVYCSVDPVDYQKSVVCPAYGATHVTGTVTYTYDSAGDKTASTDADGNTTTYTYGVSGHPGLVATMTDPDGTQTAYSYNGAGQVTAQTATFGTYSATTDHAYDTYGRQYCTVTPQEVADGVSCPSTPPTTPPTAGSDPWPGTSITIFDSDGRPTYKVNPLGGVTQTSYDQAGHPYCTVTPSNYANGTACPTSAPTSPPTVGSDPYLGATITTYDSNGRAVQVTNPLGGITLTAYDGANNVTQTTVESNNSTNAPNVITDYSYDPDNRVVSTTTNPSGGSAAQTATQSYDPNGDIYCSVSANAYQSGSSSYQCPAWQPTWITAPPSPASLYSTTPSSSQANNVTTSFHNANGQQVQTTNPDVETSITVSDGDGRTYCNADPTNVGAWLAAHTSATYPYLCPTTPPSTPPSSGSDPGYQTTVVDAAGRTLSSTDQIGDTTSYTFTPGGQTLTVTDPRGEVTTNCYYYQKANGQCAHSAPSGGGSADMEYSTTTPATSADPSGQTTTHTYLPGGAADTTTSPAGTKTDGYDANADLTSVDYTGTASGYSTPTNLSYTYNTDGARHTMVDASGTTTYTYDDNGDTTTQALTAATGSGLSNTTVDYSYNSTGVLDSVTYPAYIGHATPQVNYAYDATGSMTSETDWLGNTVTFAHDQDGNTTSQTNAVTTSNPSGTSSTAFSYDKADNNTQSATTYNCPTSGTDTLTQNFTGTAGSRNSDGQLTQYQASYSGSCSGTGFQQDYSYDQAGRVIYQGATTQGVNPNNFAYDNSGDPTTITQHNGSSLATSTQTVDAAGELCWSLASSSSAACASPPTGSTTYTYDTLGDQTQTAAPTGTTSYGYDQTGHLTTATTPTTSATYFYNADGLEAATTSGSTTSQLTWNATSSLPLVLSDTTTDYIYGPLAEPVEQISLASSTPTYLTYTPSNSTWVSTNQAGEQTGYWGYDAYGTLSFGTPTTPFGYSGQYLDATTGLVNDRARWYQPQIGGFTGRDPAFAFTDAAYTYASGDPVDNSDPTGLTDLTPTAGFGIDVTVACEQQTSAEIYALLQLRELQSEANSSKAGGGGGFLSSVWSGVKGGFEGYVNFGAGFVGEPAPFDGPGLGFSYDTGSAAWWGVGVIIGTTEPGAGGGASDAADEGAEGGPALARTVQ